MTASLQAAIQKAAALLRSARQGVALTGAGLSTPSGIPDFRSLDSGLWKRYDPMAVASLRAFRYQPEAFFAWLREIALEIQHACPNPAHEALAQLQQDGYLKTIVTQNVDGLQQRAGASRVVEVHGSLNTLTCIRCYQRFHASGHLQAYLMEGEIPRCPDCGNILKPDIILFEEQLPLEPWRQAEESMRTCDFVIVAGSSLTVMPVAGLPMQAVSHGAHLVIINKAPTYIDVRADVVLHGDVADILPLLAQEVLHG
ncbi:MAG: NAD-dependent protein deacylase Cob2 [Anaerolineales bacterium]